LHADAQRANQFARSTEPENHGGPIFAALHHFRGAKGQQHDLPLLVAFDIYVLAAGEWTYSRRAKDRRALVR
jgi:hypothetical protein